jgi:hypothetical protein
MAHSKRKEYHQQLVSYLKPGGKVILEGFSKKQIAFSSGGPREIEMLFSADELKNDFSNLTLKLIEEKTIELSEGLFHRGEAAVMRLLGVKNIRKL